MTCSRLLIVLACTVFCACSKAPDVESGGLGNFVPGQDLYLAHFDVKTDVDDVHSVAGVATMLADPRFSDVDFHAVAGTYGIQEGLYVPANELFELAFPGRWSDAHSNRDKALADVARLALDTLTLGGAIWIADAGQSDFSAALIRRIRETLPNTKVADRIHVVQHADWNERVTTPGDLAYVKSTVRYHRIPDGNAVGNGTPGFRSDTPVDWRKYVIDARLKDIWEMAIEIGDTYNGVDGRYLNESILKGGLDFSDVAETAWIFGFGGLVDANDFFREFSGPSRGASGAKPNGRSIVVAASTYEDNSGDSLLNFKKAPSRQSGHQPIK